MKKSVSRAWFAAALHEVTHGVDNTLSGAFMEAALGTLEDGKHYSRVFKELSNRGYLEGKASDIRKRIERYMEKQAKGQALTERETAELDVFHSECAPLIAEKVLNNEHFLRELVSEDASLVERLLGKLADLRESTSRVRDPEARAVIKEIRAIEETLLDAVAERGMAYRERKLVMVNREREEEKDTAGAVKESRKATEEELANRKFTYNELVTKDDLRGIVIDKSRQVPKLPDGSIDVKAMQNIVKSQCQTVQINEKDTRYYVEIPDIGRRVQITNDGIKHGFAEKKRGKSKNYQFDNARAALELPFILKSSVEVNRLEGRGNLDVPFSRVLIGTVGLENANGKVEYYAVRFVVEERTNQDPVLTEMGILGSLYASNAKKVGANNPRVIGDAMLPSGSPATYTYNIAHFLDDVKGVFGDTFSNDVYQTLGMQRKQDDFSKDLKFSRKPKAKKPENEHAFDDAVRRMEEREARANADAKAAEGEAVTRTNEEKVQVGEGEAQKEASVKETSQKKIADNSALLEREIERRLTRELRDAKTKEAKTAIALRLADVITREGAVLDAASEASLTEGRRACDKRTSAPRRMSGAIVLNQNLAYNRVL